MVSHLYAISWNLLTGFYLRALIFYIVQSCHDMLPSHNILVEIRDICSSFMRCAFQVACFHSIDDAHGILHEIVILKAITFYWILCDHSNVSSNMD